MDWQSRVASIMGARAVQYREIVYEMYMLYRVVVSCMFL